MAIPDVYGQVFFAVNDCQPQFGTVLQNGHQTVRLTSQDGVCVTAAGTPVELADFFSRAAAAIRWDLEPVCEACESQSFTDEMKGLQ